MLPPIRYRSRLFSSSQDNVVPQIIFRSPHVRPGKFVLVDANRVLQQYLPATDIVRRAGSGYASIVLAPPQPCFRYGRRLVALGALHAAFYPVERFYARRRIDAFGGEVLDVDQIDRLRSGLYLVRLMAIGWIA